MFNSPHPKVTTMELYVVGDINMTAEQYNVRNGPTVLSHWEDMDVFDFADMLTPIVKSSIKRSRIRHVRFETLAKDPGEDNFSSFDWVPLCQAQQQWAIDGKLKLQVGFYNKEKSEELPDPHPAIHTAMTLYDRMGNETGIVDPVEQAPIAVDSTLEKAFKSFVNDTYKFGSGLWCRDLVNLRNEVMVKTHAHLLGWDPESEWQRFSDAGFAHFLEFLKIAKPPRT